PADAAAAAQQSAQAREIVFVDDATPDAERLIADIAGQGGRTIDVVRIGAAEDGLARISAELAARQDISAVHIISHGSDGAVRLGASTLDAQTLHTQGALIASWRDALSADADLLIYGCDVAATAEGRALIDALAGLTGADVAASTNPTGSAALGGDWDLEYRFGAIETHLALSQEAQNEWFALLDFAYLQASQDTYIDVGNTTFNYGASTQLIVDRLGGQLGDGRVLVQFDLSSIPVGTTINSATLQMQASAVSSAMDIEVHELLEGWVEGSNIGTPGEASWDLRAPLTAWTAIGGTVDATAAATVTVAPMPGQHNWDITALVQAWIDGSKANNGVLVGSPSAGAGTVTYDSREGTTAPVLVINYGATLSVSTTNDVLDGDTSSIAALLANQGADGMISLREAIIATNNTLGADVIGLPAGTYTLSLTGSGEDATLTGDLDITDALTIHGSGMGTTIIDAAGLDRVLDIYGQVVSVEDLTLRGGNESLGGGMYVRTGSDVTLNRVLFSSNLASNGGAFYNYKSTLTMTDSTLDGNQASSFGGGIYNDWSILNLERSTVSNNTSGAGGAGIYNFGSGSTLDLVNVTVSGNIAAGDGGGISTSKPVTLTNSTIAFNTAATGGGIALLNPGTVTLLNTILANNTGGNANTALTSLGNNIDSDGTALIAGAGDLSGTVVTPIDVMLGPLQNNGGLTATHALLAGSPAINAGSATAAGVPTVDQRGYVRDGSPDIGAYEYNATANNAPVLLGANDLAPINEDPASNPGTLVSALIAGQVNDVDPGALTGIAVTAVDNTNGTWEYSRSGGASWIAFGSPSTAAARLLAADATTLVRFVPNANFYGTVTNGLTFHAWDQTSGTAGSVAAITTPGDLLDSFSAVSYSNNDGSLTWSADWIEIDGGGSGATGGNISVPTPYLQINTSTAGELIYREANLSAATTATFSYVLDNRLGAPDQIAVQVSGNGGGSFTTLQTITSGTANGTYSFDISAYKAVNTQIRFYVVSGAGQHVRLDDIQIVSTSPSAAFSSAAASASITVNAVNDAPVGVPAISGTVTEDQVLTADTSGISDADGLGAFSYQWLRNGGAIGGATASTYTLGDADVGT
ncbi:MAG: DUF4347 domain-containing protein, partial [Gammaproteobacteria bacterium]|nr:DUF4347 domain-containing protein [Gammaproteobacteria bacterium]